MHRIWKRLDMPGLELARITSDASGVTVRSSLIAGGATPVALLYTWTLTSDWRTRTLDLARADGSFGIAIARVADRAWRIDGQAAPHLDGCPELDLSATPLCNSLAMRLLDGTGELAAAYIDAETLKVTPSRQRYEKLGERFWRYIDLGVAKGFTAELRLDSEGFVRHYEGLFESV